jgi:hypothetical protein
MACLVRFSVFFASMEVSKGVVEDVASKFFTVGEYRIGVDCI